MVFERKMRINFLYEFGKPESFIERDAMVATDCLKGDLNRIMEMVNSDDLVHVAWN